MVLVLFSDSVDGITQLPGFQSVQNLPGFQSSVLEFAADSQAATGSDSTCAGDGMGNGGSLSEAEELIQLALKLEQEAL